LPFCHAELRVSKPARDSSPKGINTLGDHIRARRLDLKLLQKQVANQIGVDEATITNWERNATAPAIRYIPAILQFLGSDPLPPAISLSERLAAARRELGLSQRKMAERLGVDPATFKNWEAGRREPSVTKRELVARFLGDGISSSTADKPSSRPPTD
jgi:transcriptional regulator with XRE-family HTH domain